MISMSFEYLRPKDLAEVLQILATCGADARLLAGGTDLILELQMKKPAVRYIVDFGRLVELRGIRTVTADSREWIEIGALTPIREIETSPLLRECAPGIAQAAGSVASVQIRNRATVGGNICHAAPSADTAPALLALGTQVHIVGQAGARVVPLDRFFTGPGRTVLYPNEVVTAFRFPLPAGPSVYIKHSPRRAMDCAVVGVGAQLDLAGGVAQGVRLALGAVAPTPIRAYRAEQMLVSAGALNREALAEAAHIAAGEASPIDDIRASAWYRTRMLEVNVRRALERAAGIAPGGAQ